MYENTIEEILKAQKQNEEAMTNIIKNNSGLVWSIVKRFSGRGYSRRRIISSRLHRINKGSKKIRYEL